MRKFAIAGVTALALAGSTAVYAQHNHWFHEHMGHMQMNPEDRAAFVGRADRGCPCRPEA